MSNLWSGRFSKDTDQKVQQFTESISFDWELYPYDIQGSIAHAKGLKRAGILTTVECQKIIKGLGVIQKEIEKGSFQFKQELEDIHMNIEAALFAKIGEPAKKLHTGRSRNDQVATDMRLYLKANIEQIKRALKEISKTLIKLGEKYQAVIMPGYTHLQIAQPVLFAHHLLAYVEMFIRDIARLADLYVRVDVMPLGSAALAGTTYPLDRKYVAEELGFSAISENSLDAVSDRDFLIEFQSAATLIMLHLSRMAEEVIIWGSTEFKFIELHDAFATGSSIMPQKKNPDIAELVRGKSSRVAGALMALITLLKGLPLSYNRDLQEDKEPIFRTVRILYSSLTIMKELWATTTINAKRMKAAAAQGFSTATDLADYLVRQNIPFRDAHKITGNIVRYCIEKNKTLQGLSLAEFQKYSPTISQDVYAAISLEGSVKARDIYGGTAPKQVNAALKRALKRLE